MKKNLKNLLTAAFVCALVCPVCVPAMEMSHWAIVRSPSGEIIGRVEEGEEVEVIGICEGLLYRSEIIAPAQNLNGNVASVYIYGGTDYEYENPWEYTYTGGYEEVTDGTDPSLEAARAAAAEVREGKKALEEMEKATEADEARIRGYADVPEVTEEAQESAPEEDAGNDAYDQQEETYTYSAEEDGYSGDYAVARERMMNSDEYWIDVNIDYQWLEFYKGSECLLGVECTTGMKGVSDTPKGEFHILWKERSLPLEGENLEGVYYSKYVNFWMVLTDYGIGLHDSPWRNEQFGGDIYVDNGTLGCITTYLPTIEYIFNTVEEGTTMLIH